RFLFFRSVFIRVIRGEILHPIPPCRIKLSMEHKGDHFDVLVIGAGPTGMASAIEAQRAGFTAVLVDKGCLVNSLFHYPANIVFFTTPELLENGDIPFTTANQKPNRQESL